MLVHLPLDDVTCDISTRQSVQYCLKYIILYAQYLAKMLFMIRLRNRKCSATGPKRRCSGPEQYQYPFWYYLQEIIHCLLLLRLLLAPVVLNATTAVGSSRAPEI